MRLITKLSTKAKWLKRVHSSLLISSNIGMQWKQSDILTAKKLNTTKCPFLNFGLLV